MAQSYLEMEAYQLCDRSALMSLITELRQVFARSFLTLPTNNRGGFLCLSRRDFEIAQRAYDGFDKRNALLQTLQDVTTRGD